MDDDLLYEKCVKLRDHGRGPETKPYFNDIVGYKFMPFNLQAALGLAQFERIEELVGIKRYHMNFYKENLKDIDAIFNTDNEEVYNGAWITGVVFGKKYNIDKHSIISEAEKKNVPVRPFFYPLSSIPAFSQEKKYSALNKNAYDVSSRGINLPGSPNMTDDDLKYVCDVLKEILK